MDSASPVFAVDLAPAARPEILVVHCSAPEVQAPTEAFLARGLGLQPGTFDRIAVPGGCQFCSPLAWMPKVGWAGRKWTGFLLQGHGLHRVVCIAHRGCSWYDSLSRTVSASAAARALLPAARIDEWVEQWQVRDLHQTRQALGELMPGVSVELYYERHEGGKAQFTQVP